VVAHYESIIKTLPEKPIIIGHSMGGLITQLLIQKGLGVAGVAIHSVPPQGVLSLEWSFLKSVWGPLGYFTSPKETFLMSPKQWQYAFTNDMSAEDQQQSYEVSVIPESKLVSRGGLTSDAHINFKQPHVPLLFLSGSNDNIIPASINLSTYKRYKKGHPDSVADYKMFEGHNHYVLNLPTWHEEADYILDWVNRN
jgi:pimeloyl-ACP methyl ester carboxylesterase